MLVKKKHNNNNNKIKYCSYKNQKIVAVHGGCI